MRSIAAASRPWKIPEESLGYIHSGRVLALDRPEHDKVRPLALGNLHRRLISKAITKTFTARIQEVPGDSEYSLGSNGAAEGMHKAVLVDLDQRPNAVKTSFDISNAHNEFCREAAVKEVQTHIPTMLPWLKGHLVTDVSHVYLGDDGTTTPSRRPEEETKATPSRPSSSPLSTGR